MPISKAKSYGPFIRFLNEIGNTIGKAISLPISLHYIFLNEIGKAF